MFPTQTENINNHFFDGHYKDIWRSLIPESLTKAEVDFLINEATLTAGNQVLDLMCGYGRHALGLARKEVHVTAVDNLADYANEVKEIALKENLPVNVLQQDVTQISLSGKYDLVICLGNNLSFFDQDETIRLFAMISSCLKPGHKFVFNTWMIAEIVLKQFKEKAWSHVLDLKYLIDSKFLFFPSRIETETIFITQDGRTEVKKAVDYIYSLNETENMLKQTGFIVKDVWSIPGKKKFSLGEPRAYIIAEKI